jgi:hypothetical protein
MDKRRRRSPMTDQEFDGYLSRTNKRASPYPVLVNCSSCGKPIEDTGVIRTSFSPPLWLHRECDEAADG